MPEKGLGLMYRSGAGNHKPLKPESSIMQSSQHLNSRKAGLAASSPEIGFRFWVSGVSVRGCTGAGSTHARTPTCMSSPPLALHPRLDLHGFRVLSNSDRAPVFLFVLGTRLFRCGV